MENKEILRKLFNIQQQFQSKKDKYNNFGKFSYRSLETMMTSLKPLLAQQSCVLTFSDSVRCESCGLIMNCECTLTDVETGQFIENRTELKMDEELKGMSSGQISGVASSYARKYALCGLLSVDDGSDLDSLENSKGGVKVGIKEIDACKTLQELSDLFSTLSDADKSKLKKCFTFRRNQLENAKVPNYSI